MAQYSNSIWHGGYPQNKVGRARCRELRTFAECLDALLRGELPHLADVFMERFESSQAQVADGSDVVAQFLELMSRASSPLAAAPELRAALEDRLSAGKLANLVKGIGAKPF